MEMEEKINQLKKQSEGLGYKNETDKYYLDRLQTYGISNNAPWYVNTGANVVKNLEPKIDKVGNTIKTIKNVGKTQTQKQMLFFYLLKSMFNH